jgi:hypothetical protein
MVTDDQQWHASRHPREFFRVDLAGDFQHRKQVRDRIAAIAAIEAARSSEELKQTVGCEQFTDHRFVQQFAHLTNRFTRKWFHYDK